MENIRTRYPGAQPFSDDSLSKSVFFGREQEMVALTDQITANRLVVVYAKSGVGKTSLLQAGVCPLLREDCYAPLTVRVNDIRKGPLNSVMEGISTAAKRQGLEYHPGSQHSLWHFFKTVEFWRNDLLLTPVLLLDQFEELFTLHTPEARESFLIELGYLIRGVRPDAEFLKRPGVYGNITEEPDVSDTSPQIRVVLSLREDFLGFLEEASDRIPQILDQRFRLTPLTVEAAAAALNGPSTVEDERFSTSTFSYHPDTVQAILDYLSRRAQTGVASTSRDVEPFQLQLVCQRVERQVMKRQHQAKAQIVITMTDLGGENGLHETLRDFYDSVLRALPTMKDRRKVGQLCRNFLISSAGRRLSLEVGEIERMMDINRETLAFLVDRRLLRSDQRAESYYYELSHDSLVEPVIAASRVSMTGIGLLNLLGSILLCIFGVVCLAVPYMLGIGMSDKVHTGITIFFLVMALTSGWLGFTVMRKSAATLSMFAGAFLKGGSRQNRQPLGSVVIAGWSIIGLAVAVIKLFQGSDPEEYLVYSCILALLQIVAVWKLLHKRSLAFYLFILLLILDIGGLIYFKVNDIIEMENWQFSFSLLLALLIDGGIVAYLRHLRQRNQLL